MGHFTVLIIIPKDVYLKGCDAIIDWIHECMEPFEENASVKPYVALSRSEFNSKFNKELETNPKLTLDQYAYDCEFSFNSAGDLTSTRNPESLYDWYSIGGRCYGTLTGKSDPKINPLTIDFSQHQSLKNNMISMQSFTDEYRKTGDAYGFMIDSNGKLHHRRCLSTWKELMTPSEWKVIYEQILETNTDGYIVNLDCHC